jgi:pimeloyl-ACP methyl ester carboxylesterase
MTRPPWAVARAIRIASPSWGDVDLHWREAGSGRPLVLVHCYPVDGRLFDAQLRAAASGRLACRMILPDLPGFGSSPVPERCPSSYTVDELAWLVGELIRREGLERPIAGGVAIGGSIAMSLAAGRGHQLSALVLVANRPTGDAPELAARREAAAERVMAVGSPAVAADLADAALASRASERVRSRVRSMIAAADRRAIAALVRAIASRPDPRPVLPSLALPALVVAGSDDPFGPSKAVRGLADLLPQARFVEIRGAGHMVPIEAPSAVTREIASFLAALDAGGA